MASRRVAFSTLWIRALQQTVGQAVADRARFRCLALEYEALPFARGRLRQINCETIDFRGIECIERSDVHAARACDVQCGPRERRPIAVATREHESDDFEHERVRHAFGLGHDMQQTAGKRGARIGRRDCPPCNARPLAERRSAKDRSTRSANTQLTRAARVLEWDAVLADEREAGGRIQPHQ